MSVPMSDAPSPRRLVAARRRRQMRATAVEHLIELAHDLDLRDGGTESHCRTVARYARGIARALELPEEAAAAVHLAGLLHDVGKIGIGTEILSKQGALSESEWVEIRGHPRIGSEIVGGLGLPHICEWVHAHHERPDGAGYPRGLSAAEIPIEAKILAVADSYEAMTNDRVYKDAIGHEPAIAELQRHCGTQFDETVVEAFLGVLERETRFPAHEVSVGAA
jgi:putative nucleotidyltransferase with HDIG domain